MYTVQIGTTTGERYDTESSAIRFIDKYIARAIRDVGASFIGARDYGDNRVYTIEYNPNTPEKWQEHIYLFKL